MNMSGNLDRTGVVRRSKRLRKENPEYEPVVDPERVLTTTPKTTPQKTPKRQDGRSSRVERHLKDHFERNLEVEKKEHRFYSHHVDRVSLNGRNSYRPGGFEVLETRSDQQKISNKQSVELLCTSTFVPRLGVGESGILPPVSQSNRSSCTSISKIILYAALLLASILFLIKVFKGEATNKIDLKSMFPQQSDRLWGFVSHGIDDTNPFVLLLVHNGQADLANCLGRLIAEKVVGGRTKQSMNPIILDGRNGHSNLLLTLKPQMEKHPALVLQNIEYLHGDVADKLHFILDTHEPWIPRGVYVLTLHIPNINDGNLGESFRTIRTFLKNKWSARIKDDDLDALIARVCHFEYVLKEDTNPCKEYL